MPRVRIDNREVEIELGATNLEAALEYIESDELVEITPSSIRLRKKILGEGERRRAERGRAARVQRT